MRDPLLETPGDPWPAYEARRGDSYVSTWKWPYTADTGLPGTDVNETRVVETRIVDPATGGAKGRKMARHELLPPESLTAIAERFGLGAAKYEEDRNWEKGYVWSLSYGALQRHLLAWWGGEDVDVEFGDSHLAAAGFHIMVLLSFIENYPAGDDRPRKETT